MKLFKNLNFGKLKGGLSKTREKIANSISETISGKAKIDDEVLDEIEEILITSDIGIETAESIIEASRRAMKSEKERTGENLINVIKDELVRNLIEDREESTEYDKIDKFKPYVLLIVGVNGAGKTTTIGKLAHN